MIEIKLCEYGCGRPAVHRFDNGKWCCSSHYKKCPFIRKEQGKKLRGENNPMYGKTHNEEVRKRMSINSRVENLSSESRRNLSEGSKGQIPWNKGKTGIFSKETLKILSKSHKNILPEARKNISNFQKEKWKDPEYRKLQSKSRSGRIPWNKGKTGIFSKEALKKISEASISAHKNRIVCDETKKLQRISAIKRIKNNLEKGHQIHPNYNPAACKLIDKYGETHGYNFQHAENGGEFYIKELGYWVDGYDTKKNTVIEADESHHFDSNGNLLECDVRRQNEIIEEINCVFIRLKIDKHNKIINETRATPTTISNKVTPA